jgi:hypothetical protein
MVAEPELCSEPPPRWAVGQFRSFFSDCCSRSRVTVGSC